MTQRAIDLTVSEGPVGRQTQIRDFILAQITSGAWPENYRIPSENELVASLGVSRMTVHHALKELRDKGFLTRIQGIGTFVAAARDYATVIPHADLAATIKARGARYAVRILERRVRPASADEARLFRLGESAPLFHAISLHLENDTPIQLEDRLVNVAAAPGCEAHDLTRETLLAYLMRLRPYREGEETITARVATARECELLALAPNEPCLEVRRTTWSGGDVVTTASLLHPGSRFQISGRIASNEGRA